MPRWAKATDKNHAEIGRHLRAAGWDVEDMSKSGWGVLDYLARKHGLSLWVECKQPGEQLTPREKRFWDLAPGKKIIAYSGMDAVTQCELELRRAGL